MGFIQMTDTHFVPGDALLYDMSPKARLAEGIDLVNRDHADEAFILVTGDLAHFGEEAAYRTLKETLEAARLPVHLVLGNHDSRAPFLKVFPDTPTIAGGFVQFAVDLPEARILCLDTLNDVPGDHIGRLCEVRLDWLDREIAATPANRRLIVAAHHPFFDLGMPGLDDIKLRDAEALAEVLQRRRPDLYLFGHVHRPISGTFQGIPFHTQRAFNHQVALRFQRTEDLGFVDERPDIAIVHSIRQGFAVFTRSVGGETREFPSGAENRQSV